MPCLFGGSGASPPPTDFIGHFKKVFGEVEQRRCDSGWLGGSAHPPAQTTRIDADGKLVGVFGEHALYRAFAAKDTLHELDSDGHFVLRPQARGVLVALDPSRRVLHLAADWMSCFPLYYGLNGSVLYFSSHLKPLATLLGAPLDPTGVAEFLYEHAALNARTLFKRIRRLLPGQSVIFELDSTRLTIRETSTLWRDSDPVAGDFLEQTWERLVDACRGAQSEHAALMLSGGWDSRTLLAALVTARRGQQITTATHGDPGQLEMVLARRLAALAGVPNERVPLGVDAFGHPDDLDELFHRTETLLMPFWRIAAARLRAQGVTNLFSGVLGEVLGGHYTFFGSRVGRMREFVSRFVFRDVEVLNAVRAADELRALLNAQFSFRGGFLMRPDFWRANEREIRAGIEEDVEATITRYLSRSITSPGAIREAYITEHRGLQMICEQPLTALSSVDISIPFGRRDVMQLGTAIPVSARIHNKLSQALLRRYWPKLLRVPMAATLVPAWIPITGQEVGRLARLGLDKLSETVFFGTHGKIGRAHVSGWSNSEEMQRSPEVLSGLCGNPRWVAIDSDAMQERIRRILAYREDVALLKPFLKIAYLDRMMR